MAKSQSMLVEDELESMEEPENGVTRIYSHNERLRQFSLRTKNSFFKSPEIERKDDEIVLTSGGLKERIGDILKVVNFETLNAKDVWSRDSSRLLHLVWSRLEEETGSDLSSRKDEIASIFCDVMNEIIEEDDSLKKKDSVTVKTILKAHRKRNAENDMNKNAKRQLIRSLHEVVDETEINQRRKRKVDGADQQTVKHHRNEVRVLFLISYPFKLKFRYSGKATKVIFIINLLLFLKFRYSEKATKFCEIFT